MVNIISGAADIISLYEFLKSKLQNDHKAFIHGLKRTVKVVCKKARDNLSASSEFAGSIPEDAEDVIIEKLLECIDDGRVFEEKDILPFDVIPKQVRNSLSNVILSNLNKSLEFFQRNYDALSQQEIQGISKKTDDIIALLEKLLQDYRYDSAIRYHETSINRSRFHYSNEKTEFIGRDIQLNKLRDFCQFSPSLKGKDFAWWVVTGEGGSGKSRLCYEFLKEMDKTGWSVCTLQNHNAEKLYLCSQSVTNNTIFILDYAEYDTEAIFNWIVSFNSKQYNQNKIRVILIQRRACWADIKETIHHEIISSGFIDASLYNEDFLHIEKLDQDYTKNKVLIGEIQRSYAKNVDASLSTDETDALFDLLQKVDEELLRPLFAIILIDAYLDNREIPSAWCKKDVLNYICEREEKLIWHMTKDIFGTDQCRKMSEIAYSVLAIATMTNGLTSYSSLKEMLPEDEWQYLSQQNLEKFCENKVLFINENNEELNCPALEPDIIGEYFVLNHLNKLNKSGRAENLINVGWHKPYYMKRFMKRLFQDHKELINSECPELHDMLKKVKLPKDLQCVKNAAFEGCDWLTEVLIPKSVTSIEKNAFFECTSLTKIVIPDSVTRIGPRAFCRCTSLTEIIIPESVASIETAVFSGCSSLTEIIITGSVTNIEPSACWGCTSLTGIVIPESVTSIEKYAFCGCTSLTGIVIPESVTSIEKYAFCGCTSLIEIVIPESVTRIEEYAFYGCTSLNKIVIPKSITNIGDCTFIDCTSLTEIILPESVISIGNEAFLNCTSLTEIVISESVMSIGDNAYRGCTSLSKVVIPKSVTNIGNCAFLDCISLIEIVIPESVTSIELGTFAACTSLSKVVIPKSVTSIGEDAFLACTSLIEIVIPESVNSIKIQAFSGCTSLTKIVISESITSIGDDAFVLCDSLKDVYVYGKVNDVIRQALINSPNQPSYHEI